MMKNILLFLLLITTFISSSAQDNKYRLRMDFGPDINFYRLEDLSGFAYKNKFSYSSNLDFSYNLSRLLSIKMSAGYSKNEFKVNYNLILPQDYDPKIPIYTNYTSQFVIIKPGASFKIMSTSNISFLTGIGFDGHFLLKVTERTCNYRDEEIIYRDGEIMKIIKPNSNDFLPGVYVEGGINYFITNSLGIDLTCTYTYFFEKFIEVRDTYILFSEGNYNKLNFALGLYYWF